MNYQICFATTIIFLAIFKGIPVSPLITSGVSCDIILTSSNEVKRLFNLFFPTPLISSKGDFIKLAYLFCL